MLHGVIHGQISQQHINIVGYLVNVTATSCRPIWLWLCS